MALLGIGVGARAGVRTSRATAAVVPRVPLPVQAQIKHRAPLLAYVPTRTAIGFRY